MYIEMSGRSYRLGRRAEAQAVTRQRIVEAAVELHSTIGPARTSLSQVAERAGVQRNTLYAHFPDERALLMASSGHAIEQDPLPDPELSRAVADPRERLRTGIDSIYAWYARNEAMAACVHRDAGHHAPTREITEHRIGPAVAEWHAVLGHGLAQPQLAMLHLMLGFPAWRALVRESALDHGDAVALAAQTILGAPPTWRLCREGNPR